MRLLTIVALTFLAIAPSLHAEERYELRGRFVLDGDVPERKALKIDKDVKVCGPLLDESLIVNAQDRGIANVVLELYVAGKDKPPVHPRLEELRKAPARLESRRCAFKPHIVTVLTGQSFEWINIDTVGHNVNIGVTRNRPFSDLIPAAAKLTRTFTDRERAPVRVGCNIQPWMRSYLVITDHPYVAVSDASGKFAIGDLPPGEWKFRVWQEKSVTSMKSSVTASVKPGTKGASR